MNDVERASNTHVSRRTVTKAMAWAVPAVAVAATIPLAAASLRKDPGINGWVLNTRRGSDCTYTLEVDSDPSDAGPTDDGAPFGLYIYDVETPNVITNAALTYWIIGDHPASGGGAVTWTSYGDHSSCWGTPTRIGTETKPDGRVYTGYRWNYTCAINPANRVVGSDGVERLFLGTFHVRAAFSQSRDLCGNVTYWTQRHITIDPDGSGSLPATVHTFQRRNGSLGPMTAAKRLAAPKMLDDTTVAGSDRT